MKYLFIQRSGLPWFGVMSISAMLKQQGHDVKLFMADEEKRNLLPLARKFSPDYLLFPVITGEERWVQLTALDLKVGIRPTPEVVLGGPHVTFYPETVRSDYWIRGEADYLNEFLEQPHGVYLAEPVRDITQLPEADRSVYYENYPYLAKASSKQFLTARGCPFSCTFCSNHLTQRMFPNTPRVRRRTPYQMIDEILNVRRDWGLQTVSFTDDVFTLDNRWLSEFLYLYEENVGLPFICNTRFDIINEDLVKLLKRSGCHGLEFGIESGVEKTRREILGKGSGTNARIIEAGRMIKSAGLKLKTYNIIGLPGETLEEAMQTVRLNHAVKADQTSCSFMTPYPKYDIAKFYPPDIKITDSIYIPGKWIPKELVNLQSFFLLLSKFPWLEQVVRVLLKLPPNRLYRVLALVTYGLFMARVHKLTLKDIWNYARHISPFRI